MDFKQMFNFELGSAICYSGYREGQSPETNTFPSYEEVKEDLYILKENWKLIRLYDCGKHAEMVLEVISKEKLELRVMLGAYISAEMSNPNCPWGGIYSEEQLSINRAENEAHIQKLIKLANKYPDIIFSLSAGNEAAVDWCDHLVSEEKIIKYVRMIKENTKQPVTYCENYIPWQDKLKNLAEEVDFISIHTYPAWEYKCIDEAINYTKENYYSVANKYPDKLVAITEAGWATNSNGRGIHPYNASQDLQEIYHKDLVEWSSNNGILTFEFEAFDEEWKGSSDPMEPEKHWGLFTITRKPKKVMCNLYPELI